VAIRSYLKLQAEYGDPVHFLPVRPDFQHNRNKSYPQRRDEARAWARRVGLTGPLLVDDDSGSFLRFGKGVVPGWVRPKKPGEKPRGWGYMYILNAERQIVYQHGPVANAFRYCAARFVLDPILDAKFAEACRCRLREQELRTPSPPLRGGEVTDLTVPSARPASRSSLAPATPFPSPQATLRCRTPRPAPTLSGC